jgi:hypothetical protein
MTDTPRGLIKIGDDMLGLAAGTSGDAETLHPLADDLLIETIRRLATKAEAHEKGVTANAERIIHAWRRTPRWYA